MDIPPDELERRIRMVTRSGRAIRPPDRYEPEADQIFEDDFSDDAYLSESEEEEWGYGEAPQTEDDTAGEITDSEEDDFTDTESRDGSYESLSEAMSSEEEDDLEDEVLSETDREDCETEEDIDDVLEWDTLTADASDRCLSEDDQDL